VRGTGKEVGDLLHVATEALDALADPIPTTDEQDGTS
jgi:hypothetical protein